MKRVALGLALLALMASPVVQAEEPAKPSVDQIVKDIAAIGPDALLARVKQLKDEAANLNKAAGELRKQADGLDGQANALRAQIAAVEKFTTELVNAMAPPAPPAAPAPATPAAQPAPAAAAPAPAAEPAPAAAAPPAEAAPAKPKE